MRSVWQEGTFQAQHPTIVDEQVVLSSQEFSMLQQIRSLNGGSHTMYLVKTARGRDGLHSFRLGENKTEVE
jgi:hypothetical protein